MWFDQQLIYIGPEAHPNKQFMCQLVISQDRSLELQTSWCGPRSPSYLGWLIFRKKIDNLRGRQAQNYFFGGSTYLASLISIRSRRSQARLNLYNSEVDSSERFGSFWSKSRWCGGTSNPDVCALATRKLCYLFLMGFLLHLLQWIRIHFYNQNNQMVSIEAKYESKNI